MIVRRLLLLLPAKGVGQPLLSSDVRLVRFMTALNNKHLSLEATQQPNVNSCHFSKSSTPFHSSTSIYQYQCFTSFYSPLVRCLRFKSKKKQYYNSDDDSDSDIDDHLDEDDFEAPAQFKVLTIHAPSLRTDAVISNSLGISRHRLEELFLSSCLLINGGNLTKKGIKLDEGDYVDVIMEKLEDQIKVKRAKLLKISSQKTGTDKFILKVRVWKTPFLLNYIRKRNRP